MYNIKKRKGGSYMTVTPIGINTMRTSIDTAYKTVANAKQLPKIFPSGTKVLNTAKIKTVAPGENTKLGKLGVSSITCYKKGFFPHSDNLISIKLEGNKKSVGLMNTKEAHSFIKMLSDLKKIWQQEFRNA